MEKKPEFHRKRSGKRSQVIITMRKEDIICYSANVNPLGLSEKVKSQHCPPIWNVITRYLTGIIQVFVRPSGVY